MAESSAIVRLRTALDRLADALATGDLAVLLSCETEIEEALASTRIDASGSAVDSAVVRQEIDAMRSSLRRCKTLGAALTTFVGVSLDAQGRATDYRHADPLYAGRSLDTRA